MKKKEPLTETERNELATFIGTCVLNNITFPPTLMGGYSRTIQDLINNTSIETLDKYADFLENQAGRVTRSQRKEGITEKTISGTTITYSEVVRNIDHIVKMKEREEYEMWVSNETRRLNNALDTYKSNEEKTKELKEQLAALNA